ncbi:MAG: hypothetical protein JNL74_11190 [Fibrobacteres bacterium]|nr:hypothetical protein [Fibrobacterota bacterium]
MKHFFVILAHSLPLLFIIVLCIHSVSQWFLPVGETPEKVDLIFTFGGEQARENHAKRLMNMYPNAKWIASNPLSGTLSAKDTSEWAPRFMQITGNDDTKDEVRYILSLCNDSIEIALVSGPYHMRRIEHILRMIRPENCSARFHFVAVPINDYTISRLHIFKLFISEMAKTVNNTFQVRFGQ